MSLQNLRRSKIDWCIFIRRVYWLDKELSKIFWGLRASPIAYTGTPKRPKIKQFGVPVYPKGEALRPPKNFWELFIKSIDPPNKDTSINFTPSQILEGQYVLVSFSSLYYSIKIQRLWRDPKHEKCWIFFHSVNYSRSNEWD